MALYRDDDNDPYGDPYAINQPNDPRQLYGGIGAAYKKYLGRDARQDELEFHARTSPTNFEQVIKGSTEAQQWAARGSQPQTQVQATAPRTSFSEQALRDAWAATPDHTPANLARMAQQYGIQSQGDVFILPDGRKIDAIMDENGRNAPGWIDQSRLAYGGASLGSTGADQRSGSGTGGSRSSGSTIASASRSQDDNLRQQLINQLMQRAGQTLQVDRNDPTLRAQADPMAANIERERRNYLADVAERSGPLANLQGETRLASERAGQAKGLFEAQLIGREIESRRSEIADALSSLQGLLTTGQEMSLRRELAELDDATKRLGLQYQSQQFGDQLGLAYNQFDWLRDPSNPNNIPNFNG
jgi:hypothetical protein